MDEEDSCLALTSRIVFKPQATQACQASRITQDDRFATNFDDLRRVCLRDEVPNLAGSNTVDAHLKYLNHHPAPEDLVVLQHVGW